jgi:hypothetical protein
MPIKYYPSFAIVPNQITRGTDFTINGIAYTGLYYKTIDGQYFSGPNPTIGPSDKLTLVNEATSVIGQSSTGQQTQINRQIARSSRLGVVAPNTIIPYYPKPLSSDYDNGYINRYFVKRKNNSGYVTEINPSVYIDIVNGVQGYDTSMLQVCDIAWKLTGPLHTIRISQYDIRSGIIETNERLVKQANLTCFGLYEFIGGQYDKFAKPTI